MAVDIIKLEAVLPLVGARINDIANFTDTTVGDISGTKHLEIDPTMTVLMTDADPEDDLAITDHRMFLEIRESTEGSTELILPLPDRIRRLILGKRVVEGAHGREVYHASVVDIGDGGEDVQSSERAISYSYGSRDSFVEATDLREASTAKNINDPEKVGKIILEIAGLVEIAEAVLAVE